MSAQDVAQDGVSVKKSNFCSTQVSIFRRKWFCNNYQYNLCFAIQ